VVTFTGITAANSSVVFNSTAVLQTKAANDCIAYTVASSVAVRQLLKIIGLYF
jgi:hypothetical protein